MNLNTQENQNIAPQETNQQPKQVDKQPKQQNQTDDSINGAKILNQLKKLNQTVIKDIFVKKGRIIKFQTYKSQLNQIFQHYRKASSSKRSKSHSIIFERFSIIYYNLAKLGESESTLEKAIEILNQQAQNKFIVLKWKMQLAAMMSSSNRHQQSFDIGVQVCQKICIQLTQIGESIKNQKPKLFSFIRKLLTVINSQKKSQIIWVHNQENNLKYLINHLKSILIDRSFAEQGEQLSSEEFLKPYFSNYDFHISDYMALQVLDIDYLDKSKEDEIKNLVKQITVFYSIACFTQATQKYYMKDFSYKDMHFKAIKIALVAFNQSCTYIMFLTKIINDHYGAKLSQIREENSDIFLENNEMKRRIPRDKKQVSMRFLNFAE